jgi:asparagine synthase (glutamine-hydrolysing)
MTESVRLRLAADVPVGAYLSGGIDSTFVTALAVRLAGAQLKTFSVSFDDGEFDESAYQKIALDRLGTDHHTVRCSTAEIARVFPDIVWHAEKPLLRTAPAPLFLLSRAVRAAGMKTVLTGEGSDELLGGYDIFKEAKIRRFLSVYPDSRLRPLLLRRLYPYQPALVAQSDAYRQAFFGATRTESDDPLFSHRPRWNLTSRLKIFYSPEVRAALGSYDAVDELLEGLPSGFRSWHPFSQAEYLETAHLLPGYILSSQGDRMAMAHSVEGRFPFLDSSVARFAGELPPRLKMKALNEKYLLKRAAIDIVPPSIVRRPKQPYRAPGATSFFDADGNSPEYVRELLSPSRLRDSGIFDVPAVGQLLA